MPPAIEILHGIAAILFCLVLAFAAVVDVRERRIPNWTIAAILALSGPWVLTGHDGSAVSQIGSSLGAAGLLLLATVPLYAFRIIGAGDSKLLAAVGVFVGLHELPQFTLTTALAGGLVAVVVLAAEPRRVLVAIQTHFRARLGLNVPYGVAIALAGVVTIAGRVL